jgi:hypothetical protein
MNHIPCRKDVPCIQTLLIEVDGGNDAILVTANVEHVKMSDVVDGSKGLFEIFELENTRNSMIFRQACSGVVAGSLPCRKRNKSAI